MFTDHLLHLCPHKLVSSWDTYCYLISIFVECFTECIIGFLLCVLCVCVCVCVLLLLLLLFLKQIVHSTFGNNTDLCVLYFAGIGSSVEPKKLDSIRDRLGSTGQVAAAVTAAPSVSAPTLSKLLASVTTSGPSTFNASPLHTAVPKVIGWLIHKCSSMFQIVKQLVKVASVWVQAPDSQSTLFNLANISYLV